MSTISANDLESPTGPVGNKLEGRVALVTGQVWGVNGGMDM